MGLNEKKKKKRPKLHFFFLFFFCERFIYRYNDVGKFMILSLMEIHTKKQDLFYKVFVQFVRTLQTLQYT